MPILTPINQIVIDPLQLTSYGVHVMTSAMLVYQCKHYVYFSIHKCTKKMVICAIVDCSNTSKRVQDMSFILFQQYNPPKSKRAQPKAERSLASAHSPGRPRTVVFVKYIHVNKTCSSKPSWLSILDILAAWLCNSCQ